MISEIVGLVSESAVVVSESPLLASDSWLVSESWLVSDSAALVTDSVVLVTHVSANPVLSIKGHSLWEKGHTSIRGLGFKVFFFVGGGGFKLLRLRGFRAVSLWRVEKSGRR